MERRNNYLLQLQQARDRFTRYDQQALIQKLKIPADALYLYVTFFGRSYRICRHTGTMEFRSGDLWRSGNTFVEGMTLLDLICDSRPDRYLSLRWKDMKAFGHMFHRELLDSRDPYAELFDREPDRFCRRCEALGGKRLPFGDHAYAIEVFDGLCVAVQLWHGDEEFPPKLRLLWDENALMYLRYETMYYARGILMDLLTEE